MIEGERESQVVKENELYTLSTSIYLDCHIVSMKLSQPLSELRKIPDNLREISDTLFKITNDLESNEISYNLVILDFQVFIIPRQHQSAGEIDKWTDAACVEFATGIFHTHQE